MKLLNNYNELIIAIDLEDIKRFEDLLAYSDCRSELINRYIENYGIESINKVMQKIQAKALKINVEKICMECEDKECRYKESNPKSSIKRTYINKNNIVSNLFLYHTSDHKEEHLYNTLH